jgi:hypothetical protein
MIDKLPIFLALFNSLLEVKLAAINLALQQALPAYKTAVSVPAIPAIPVCVPCFSVTLKSRFFATIITLAIRPTHILTVVGLVASIIVIHPLVIIGSKSWIFPVFVVVGLFNFLLSFK